MKVGSLVKAPNGQLRPVQFAAYRYRGIGVVLDVTPCTVHVRWSNGEELTHKADSFGVAQHFEVLAL